MEITGDDDFENSEFTNIDRKIPEGNRMVQ